MTPEEVDLFNRAFMSAFIGRPHAALVAAGVSEKTIAELWTALQAQEKTRLRAEVDADQVRLTAKQARLAELDAKP